MTAAQAFDYLFNRAVHDLTLLPGAWSAVADVAEMVALQLAFVALTVVLCSVVFITKAGPFIIGWWACWDIWKKARGQRDA